MCGNVEHVHMKILGKLMFLSMLKPNMWNLPGTIVLLVGTFAKLFLPIKVTSKETTEIDFI
jgi:hypothetical protein